MSNAEVKSTRPWQEIAAEAAKETDSEKLIALAAELERAFEERDRALNKPAPSKSCDSQAQTAPLKGQPTTPTASENETRQSSPQG